MTITTMITALGRRQISHITCSTNNRIIRKPSFQDTRRNLLFCCYHGSSSTQTNHYQSFPLAMVQEVITPRNYSLSCHACTLPVYVSLSRCGMMLSTTTNNNGNDNDNHRERPDPFARRPNQKCDPYGQGGKPLDNADAERLLSTIDDEWRIEKLDMTTKNKSKNKDDNSLLYLVREFQHDDYLSASNFIQEMAALAQMNNHYPWNIKLQRNLNSKAKQWQIITTIELHTKVLQGLSHHDFYLAMLIDVEIERPEINRLLQTKKEK